MTRINLALLRKLNSSGKTMFSSFLLALVIALPALACSLSSDRTTTEVNATTEPEVQPTSGRVVVAATSVSTRAPANVVSSPTANPQIKLEVGSYSTYPSSIGGMYVVGEVLNKGDAPASRIQVAISLLDGSGNVLAASSSNLADIHVAPAGGKFPFLALISKPPSAYKEVKIQVQGEPYVVSSIFPEYLNLKVDRIT